MAYRKPWSEEEEKVLHELMGMNLKWPSKKEALEAFAKVLISRSAASIDHKLQYMNLEIKIASPQIDMAALTVLREAV